MTYRWVPITEQVALDYEENAQRHDARALWHEEQGHPAEWAAGSRRKAAKWRAKRDAWNEFWNPTPKTPAEVLIQARISIISARVSAAMDRALHGAA